MVIGLILGMMRPFQNVEERTFSGSKFLPLRVDSQPVKLHEPLYKCLSILVCSMWNFSNTKSRCTAMHKMAEGHIVFYLSMCVCVCVCVCMCVCFRILSGP